MTMETPICDFVRQYAQNEPLRLHMPGHKGKGFLGAERLDITEINGADVLYHAGGIIKRSEENAASLFGTARTLYSAEGSSLAIRAMLYLTMLYGKTVGRRPLIAAGRNAHKSFMTATALLDLDVVWLHAQERESLLTCQITGKELEQALRQMEEKPLAVYLTSPDYLGNMADIRRLARVCHGYGALLLVDNAHGAYLNFLPESCHPIFLGADACCDSAHKTLPVLTGGAYLHISPDAPKLFSRQAESAMSLFTSTSPSYLILQSLDGANQYLAEGYQERLADFAAHVSALKECLRQKGYLLAGDEPLKLTLMPKAYGYRGTELAELLREKGIVCEFADPDYLVMMLTPEIGREGLERLERALRDVERRDAIMEKAPPLPTPKRVLSIREALLSPSEELEASKCAGRILADANVSCPPAVPILVCGERVDEKAIACFAYYGIEKCRVVAKNR